MPTSVTMPALGESVTEGTVTRWLKQEGEQVAADEPLLEVSTDKVDTEIPSPAAGTLTKILVAEAQLIFNWEALPDEVAALIHPHPTQSEAIGEAHLALAGKPLHAHS